MSTQKETLIDWLRDAHAMEKEAVVILEKQAKRTSNYPILQNKIESHLEESREHAEKVEGCLKRLGSDTSTAKKSAGKLIGNLAAYGNAAAGDEVIKHGIADFAFENLEIASYTSIISAAEHLGEDDVRQTCEGILRQEKEMAQWIEDHLGQVTQQYLQREANPDATAKI